MKTEIELKRIIAGMSFMLVNDKSGFGNQITKIIDVLLFIDGHNSPFSMAADGFIGNTKHMSDEEVVELIANIADATSKYADDFHKEGAVIIDKYLEEMDAGKASGKDFMPFAEYIKLHKRGQKPVGGDADPSLN